MGGEQAMRGREESDVQEVEWDGDRKDEKTKDDGSEHGRRNDGRAAEGRGIG